MNWADPISRLSDPELQARIERFRKTVESTNARYLKSGSIADRVARDAAWLSEQALLQERSRRSHIVRAMEEERGLG